MSSLIKKILLLVIVVAAITPVVIFYTMKVSPISWQLLTNINEDNGLAAKGYDVVAYIYDGKAIAGDTGKGIRHEETIWYFSTDENKLTFKTFPEKFQPQYGGYCATAVASGFTADINPEIWHIENGKLYFFFDDAAKNDFIANISQGIIQQADSEWAQR